MKFQVVYREKTKKWQVFVFGPTGMWHLVDQFDTLKAAKKYVEESKAADRLRNGGMSVKEIERNIRKEENRIKRLKQEIVSIRADIQATRKARDFWREELRKKNGGKPKGKPRRKSAKCVHDCGTVMYDGARCVRCSAFDMCRRRSVCNPNCGEYDNTGKED